MQDGHFRGRQDEITSGDSTWDDKAKLYIASFSLDIAVVVGISFIIANMITEFEGSMSLTKD